MARYKYRRLCSSDRDCTMPEQWHKPVRFGNVGAVARKVEPSACNA